MIKDFLYKCSFFVLLIIMINIQLTAQCNGHADLCDRKFNEVAMVMTHNAYNINEEGFQGPNQTFSISRQLNDGVRGLMMDIHDQNGEVVVYHGFSLLGSQPLQEDLAEIKTFLDNHPNEIVSIIFETNVTSTQLENELIDAGLFSYLHSHTLGTEWATLQEMIDAGERLVIFSESDNGLSNQAWYHYAWEHVFDTPYSFSDASEFNCDLNRGSSSNSLFLVNHWITNAVGLGDSLQAASVNVNPLLINRLNECETAFSRIPNFIGVDFYHIGDALENANTLNDVIIQNQNIQEDIGLDIYPNPIAEYIFVENSNNQKLRVQINDVLGRELVNLKTQDNITKIDLDKEVRGIVICSIFNENNELIHLEKMYRK